MLNSRKFRAGAAVATCAVVGAAAGIAGSAAAPSHKAQAPAAQAGPDGPGRLAGGPRMMFRGGHAVHADEVSLNRAGTAFITQIEDNGVLKSVSGSDITITEGTTSVPYKDVSITLPAAATIRRNGVVAKVSDLKVGDHVHVSQSADGTDVFAADASFRPFGDGRGPDGPGRQGGFPHGGPPPVAPLG